MTTTAETQEHSDVTSAPPGSVASPDIASLIRLGWLMSQVYHDIPERSTHQRNGLPAVTELGRADRMALSFAVLDRLLAPLSEPALTCSAAQDAWEAPTHRPCAPAPSLAPAAAPPAAAPAAADAEAPTPPDTAHTAVLPATATAPADPRDTDLAGRTAAMRTELDGLNTQILTTLSLTGVLELTAYVTGRQLADTCRVPDRQLVQVAVQLDHYRVAEIQANLAMLATRLPNRAAEAVSRSLGHWHEWAAAGGAAAWTVQDLAALLGRQGRVWQSLLTGATDPETLLTVEPCLAAMDSASATASRAGRHLARQFWLPLLSMVAVVAFLVVLSLAKAPGEAKVWTSLVSIAAGLGVTGASLRTAAKRGVTVARSQMAAAIELEALGWSATISPEALSQHPRRRRRRPRSYRSGPSSAGQSGQQ
jgi:hypothetical protein